MERIAPFYRKAADLYPRKNSNTFRNFFGLFRNLKVRDGNQTRVLHMTDEQIEHVKKNWDWCSATMESASRGALRMVNTFKVIDEDYDSINEWDPRPFQGIIEPGSTEVFVKMTRWGASACCGMDTGPDRSAFINLGIREWDVMLHEWNHSMDWAMIASELGVGVPETHSSDWCGFQPISSMGIGHHSCNRYYMTPGMYRMVRGSDPVTTKHVDAWQVSGPYISALTFKTRSSSTRLTQRTLFSGSPPSTTAKQALHRSQGRQRIRGPEGVLARIEPKFQRFRAHLHLLAKKSTGPHVARIRRERQDMAERQAGV